MLKKFQKKIIFLVTSLIIIILLIILIHPININTREVERVSVLMTSDSNGDALIVDDKEINEIIGFIENILAIKASDSLVNQIGGDTPDIAICFFNEKGEENHTIYLYGNVMIYDDNYYKLIGLSQKIYDKFKEVCER